MNWLTAEKYLCPQPEVSMFDFEPFNAVCELYGAALPASLLMAIVFSIFGVFVVLKRIVFIGITLSEVAAFGVAVALLAGLPPFAGAAILCLGVVALLAYPYESTRLTRDTILGTIFIFASGMSILLVAKSGFGLEKVKAILYGNLLFASDVDLLIITAVMIPAVLITAILYRPLLYSFLDRESALTLGINVWRYELMFFIFLGLIVASSSKIAGVMLVFCYLLVPPATALLLARHMKSVILWSCILAVISTLLGILTSYKADLPSNQLVAVISCIIFTITLFSVFIKNKYGRYIGIVTGLTLAVLLMLGLDSLSIKAVAETHSAESSVHTHAQKRTKELLIADNGSVNWFMKTKELKEVAQKDLKKAVDSAIVMLKKNPPDFFVSEIVETISQNSDKELNWDYAKSPDAEENLRLLISLRDDISR
jgi:zinc transport system permease protein